MEDHVIQAAVFVDGTPVRGTFTDLIEEHGEALDEQREELFKALSDLKTLGFLDADIKFRRVTLGEWV